MNWDQIQGNWNQMKGKAREKWGELTDNELQEAKGEREQMVGLIQEKYGKTREAAEREVAEWQRALCDAPCAEHGPPGQILSGGPFSVRAAPGSTARPICGTGDRHQPDCMSGGAGRAPPPHGSAQRDEWFNRAMRYWMTRTGIWIAGRVAPGLGLRPQGRLVPNPRKEPCP